jgi:hypothetical protein
MMARGRWLSSLPDPSPHSCVRPVLAFRKIGRCWECGECGAVWILTLAGPVMGEFWKEWRREQRKG